MSLEKTIAALRAGETLGKDGAWEAMSKIMSGAESADGIKDFLLELNERRIGAEELAGFALGMRAAAVAVKVSRSPLIDTCGTGGDGLHTVNVSTTAAFIAAGAGAAVAKHGNRSVSSKCGSADVLEALGVSVGLSPEEAVRSIEETGFAFLFAPLFHPAMKVVAPVRRALGVRTVFNLLGPLANPASVRRQVIGVYDDALLETYAETVLLLGAERALIVRGTDGMDELSLCAATWVVKVDKGKVSPRKKVAPEDFGFKRRELEELKGGDAAFNARALEAALGGEPGAALDAALLNAGAALWAAGIAQDIRGGIKAARESVSSGNALAALNRQRGGKS